MAAQPKEEPQNGGEYKRPDAVKAFEIYDKQIKPKLTHIATLRGDCSDPWGDIKEHAHFPRAVMNFIIALENIEDDAKRDHFLLALSDGLNHRRLYLPRDLVTMADGEDGGPVVPTGERQRPKLATLDGDHADDFEASEDELSAQRDRPSVEQAQAEADAESEEEVPAEAAE